MSDDKTGNKTPAEVLPLRPPRPCPICGKPSVRAFYPFSSKRCADIDLNRWLSGGYVLAPPPEDDTGSDALSGDDGEGER